MSKKISKKLHFSTILIDNKALIINKKYIILTLNNLFKLVITISFPREAFITYFFFPAFLF